MAALTIHTAPQRVLTAAAMRLHCRIDHTAEDALLEAYIDAAQRQAEEISGRAIGETVYALRLSRFPAAGEPIMLPRPRCKSLDQVTWITPDGTTHTAEEEDFQLGLHLEPALIYPLPFQRWPETSTRHVNAVTIMYTAGETSPQPMILQALRLAVADWYQHREASLEATVSRLPNGSERLLTGVRFRSGALQRFLAEH